MTLECLVIGLGIFGKSLAKNLKKQGAIVIGIDVNDKMIREMEKEIDQVIKADASVENNLRALGVENFDYVFVCIGVHLEASLLTTLHLNNLGAKIIVARSNSKEHSLMLQRLGAHRVITPEIETGRRLAQQITSKFEAFIRISDNFVLVQVQIPEQMVGKTLKELNLRQKYKLNVLTIQKNTPFVDQNGEDVTLVDKEEVPSPDYRFNPFDKIYLMGDLKNIQRFLKNFSNESSNAS